MVQPDTGEVEILEDVKPPSGSGKTLRWLKALLGHSIGTLDAARKLTVSLPYEFNNGKDG
ncbi:MAG: hypothetical protein HC925_05430 [Coleofasciculaceae cyanobacterium SM2_3_26]|nr:hypothetical protein [Coleofasciculaceae cyanobacterium SM2_3_26]